MDDKLKELLDKYFDDAATPTEREDLAALLRDDSTAREEFWRAAELQAQLRAAVDLTESRTADAERIDPPGEAPQRHGLSGIPESIHWRRHPGRFVSLTAALTVAFVTAFFAIVWPRLGEEEIAKVPEQLVVPVERPAAVAYLKTAIDVEWNNDAEDLPVQGAVLRQGDLLRLKSGVIEIVFETRAAVTVEGPAEFALTGPNAGRLGLGQLVARVETAEARGFTIETPTTTIKDLGTEFGVSVDALGHAYLQVFVGEVAIVARGGTADETKAKNVIAGQAVRVERGSPQEAVVIRRVEPSADMFRFARRLPGEVNRFEFENNGKDSVAPRPARGQVGERVNFVAGRFGRGAKFGTTFSGAADGIVVPRASAFDPGSGDFSITYWVQWLDADTGSVDGVLDTLDGEGKGYQLAIGPSGNAIFRLDDNAGNFKNGRSAPFAGDGLFHHVAITFDRTNDQAIFYIDGVGESPINISGLTGSITPNQNMQIGTFNFEGLEGVLDDLRFFRRKLTADEVAELAAAEPDKAPGID